MEDWSQAASLRQQQEASHWTPRQSRWKYKPKPNSLQLRPFFPIFLSILGFVSPTPDEEEWVVLYFTPSLKGGSHSYQKMWDTSEHKANLYLIHINERHWASWMENCQRERSTLIDYGLEWDDKDQSPLYTQNRKSLSGVNDWTETIGKTVDAGRETEIGKELRLLLTYSHWLSLLMHGQKSETYYSLTGEYIPWADSNLGEPQSMRLCSTENHFTLTSCSLLSLPCYAQWIPCARYSLSRWNGKLE